MQQISSDCWRGTEDVPGMPIRAVEVVSRIPIPVSLVWLWAKLVLRVPGSVLYHHKYPYTDFGRRSNTETAVVFMHKSFPRCTPNESISGNNKYCDRFSVFESRAFSRSAYPTRNAEGLEDGEQTIQSADIVANRIQNVSGGATTQGTI